MTVTAEATIDRERAVCALVGVEKRFGGVVALAGVDLEVRPGLVHAIVGENGAGKSTLMKIIAGAETPDAGTVSMDGTDVHFSSVKAANDHGVAIVFQELSLYPELDVLANLFMQREITRLGLVQRAEMRRRAAAHPRGARARCRPRCTRRPALAQRAAARRDRQGPAGRRQRAHPR